VFYVISGYLITSLLVQEWEERGTIRLLNFWGRRMRRILPAGVLVLCASLVGAAILLPSTLASRAAHDLPAAALYYINWHLADQAVDYFASTEPSVYLQYWSLAIEEQFYAVWPLIVLLTAMTAARFFRSNASARVYVLWTGIAISALSFGVCLYLTSQDQPFAFFGTFSRAWQLGLGAAIGLMPLIPINELASRLLAVAGLAAIVLAALVFTSATPYPGIAAVLPTTGAAAIILAGRRGDIGGAVGGALRSPALVRLGKWSYSWYLWHWPILFFGSILLARSPVAVAFLILLSLLLACLTYYLIEQPVRFSPSLVQSPRASVMVGLALSLGTAGFAVLAQMTFAKPVIYLSTGERLSAEAVRKDKTEECLLGHHETEQEGCIFGDLPGSRRVVLFGDSHAAALLPAVKLAAKKSGWTLLVLTKASCPSINVSIWNEGLRRRYVECDTWRTDALSELVKFDPNLIFLANSSASNPVDINGRRLKGKEARHAVLDGEMSLVDQLLDRTRAAVVLVRDVPRLPDDPVTCLVENPLHESSCSWTKSQTNYPRGRYERYSKVKVLDLNSHICPEDTCKAVLNGQVVRRDKHHLTASFAATLAPYFQDLLRAQAQ